MLRAGIIAAVQLNPTFRHRHGRMRGSSELHRTGGSLSGSRAYTLLEAVNRQAMRHVGGDEVSQCAVVLVV